MILQRKGRNALIGVVVTHLGILILIVGVIYGGMTGFRHDVKAIEDEMTIVPGLPFVIHLDKLEIETYSEEILAGMNPQALLNKKQDSHLSLLKNGKPWKEFVARPGKPVRVDGITILPSLNDIGWYFELILTDLQGREKTIPIRPWQPPIINVGGTPVMAHSLMDTSVPSVQIFTIKNEQMTQLGIVSREQALELNSYSIELGTVSRYTGLLIYNRPQTSILVIGCLAMLFGLVWHFYFRHRDRRQKEQPEHV